MSRSGYSDDCEGWSLIRWRGAVTSAIRGKRGQAFLREALAALDALPEPALIPNNLAADGAFCTLGAVGRARGTDLSGVDIEDHESVANLFGVPHALACEVMFENDELGGWDETPRARWERMRRWIVANLNDDQPSDRPPAAKPWRPAMTAEVKGLVERRRLVWFSDGIASAIAARLYLRDEPDALVVHCDTGSEDEDNARFRADVARWLNREIVILKNDDFEDTHAVYRKRRYMSGVAGAPCTGDLKVWPRMQFQRPDDIHVFGYTADQKDVERFANFGKNYPEMTARSPLIERGVTKAACLAMIQSAGIEPPRTYAMGFPNANCLKRGCVKATSPDYWALFRKVFPDRFAETAALARELGCRLVIMEREKLPDGRVKNIRGFIDDIPADWPTLNPIAPACDFLCHIAGQDMAA